ncbi:chitin disaccharide deacetylase [Clostridium septicum]|uniref:Carbohydrate deacetylase n=1 Tax=Clostridium septicum TaxID=1504 RepID=A0A9N7JM07_CLOSE|nr:chitin disaccharide deacetylase [Clostridium septicum]AYE35129.1 chitin disaccharide deacetylase [Clostridium septicum]MDU1314227.1 chitin disaccharide deacetylase [Clostridium septicum]QAS60521.1 chitin disaccharide deacetylase [Clostridium septicum]UEC20220.1 chitin disaccharide deacetylase [Clostridium septicum]USS01726.1 chitin disaccharide deacetylase [Clostridium septicum]
MKLIVNSDDFGISKSVTLGIIEAHKNGVVTSTTLMCNMENAKEAVELSREFKDLGVGIHLVLTAGYPLAKGVSSLIDESGKFLKIDKIREVAKIEDIRKEFKCQMEKFLSFGIKPTHIDTHHHVHSIPKVLEVVKELALEYNLPIRILENERESISREIKGVDKFVGSFYDNENITVENFIDILEKNKDVKVLEIMCHPGYLDDYILNNSSYSIQRTKELKTLTNNKIKEYINKNKIDLINYKNI